MRLYCERCLNDKVEVFQDPDDSEFGEWLCSNCRQNMAEAAYERMCEDFHDGGSQAWPDAERKRIEEARKLK
jgi:ribosomal protein L37AE/L43A